jgi:hypothetical protein
MEVIMERKEISYNDLCGTNGYRRDLARTTDLRYELGKLVESGELLPDEILSVEFIDSTEETETGVRYHTYTKTTVHGKEVTGHNRY